MERITVIGAGLAGCEAAYRAAEAGVGVDLYEMKPARYTPAHSYRGFAELVCSNSLRSNQLSNAVGLLKEEMRLLGSLIMRAAYATQVPAGSALAVDRTRFSDYITDAVCTHPLITVHQEEILQLPASGIVVVATGPLTSEALAADIREMVGGEQLHFYDAAAPIVDFATVDTERAFFASRYGKGAGDDYLNCPMNREEYDAFYDALIHAEEAELHDFDRSAQKELTVFEGCMPVEIMAKRGYDTLRFGPLKPVGLTDPRTGREAYATVQLRRENLSGTMYNLVGFQTHLKFPEQKRVFRMIPALHDAEFFRYGVMHRNTYLNSPRLLTPHYGMRTRDGLFFAGQMTGVEGYVESAASGFVAGVAAASLAKGRKIPDFSECTELGALGYYVSRGTSGKFQPMNANFGILAAPDCKIKGGKVARNAFYAERSLSYVRGSLYPQLTGKEFSE